LGAPRKRASRVTTGFRCSVLARCPRGKAPPCELPRILEISDGAGRSQPLVARRYSCAHAIHAPSPLRCPRSTKTKLTYLEAQDRSRARVRAILRRLTTASSLRRRPPRARKQRPRHGRGDVVFAPVEAKAAGVLPRGVAEGGLADEGVERLEVRHAPDTNKHPEKLLTYGATSKKCGTTVKKQMEKHGMGMMTYASSRFFSACSY